jgi:hypothetical protein
MFIVAGRRAVAIDALPSRLPKDAVVVRSAEDLKTEALPMERLVAVWNGLPGARKLEGFKDRDTAVQRLWAALQKLPAPPKAVKSPAEPKRKKHEPAVRADSKQAQVVAMLRHPKGATIEALAKATGWQRHSVRGLIAGALKKRLGLKVKTPHSGAGQRVYRIVA